MPKVPSRKYYIDRVTEITKNSWKQDTDLHRILKEIREVQLESNSIQERLHRTYAVVEETVFRYKILHLALVFVVKVLLNFRKILLMFVHIEQFQKIMLFSSMMNSGMLLLCDLILDLVS